MMSEPTVTKTSKRFMELEGLRGIAAIVVVAYHAILMLYPGIAYGYSSALVPASTINFEHGLYGNPLNVFLSGLFAVAIFFVLSGFVLSIGFFQTGKESIVKRLASKRYLRLMLPALASVLLAYGLIVAGLSVNRQATVDIAHSGPLADVWHFVPNFFDAAWQGVWSIFNTSGSSYNAVLWTMYYEFIGSFMIFITLLVFGKSRYRWLIYGALVVSTINSWFLAIILGMVLADVYANKLIPVLLKKRTVLWGILAGGLLLGGYPAGSSKGTVYQMLNVSWGGSSLYLSVGAVCVVLVILHLKTLTRFFASPRISILGRYTYSLYLTHSLILFTLGTTLFVLFSRSLGVNQAALVSIVLTIPGIIGVTWLFEKFIDAPAIKFANYVSDVAFDKRRLHVREWVFSTKVRVLAMTTRTRQAWAERPSYKAADEDFE